MPQQPDIHVRRYVVYEELTIPGGLVASAPEAPDESGQARTVRRVGAGVGRVALAAVVTLAPLCVAGLARLATRRALIGPRRRTPALPYRP